MPNVRLAGALSDVCGPSACGAGPATGQNSTTRGRKDGAGMGRIEKCGVLFREGQSSLGHGVPRWDHMRSACSRPERVGK